MTPAPDIHIIYDDEIAEVEALGFTITSGKIPAAEFLNQHFAGLRLKDYLKGINDLLGPLTAVTTVKEFAYFESPPQMVVIQYYSEDEENDQTGLAFSQAIIKRDDEMVAELDFLRIPATFRNQGIAKRLLNLCLQQYSILGVDKIRLLAALTNGGLVWAKAFFVAIHPEEVKLILESAEKRLTAGQFMFVKRIYDNYYNQYPFGKAFPMVKWSQLSAMAEILNGSHWHGELDLNNSQILAKFKNYVA